MKNIAILFLLVIATTETKAQLPTLNWAKGIGGNNNESGNSIIQDANKNVYVTGIFEGTVDFDPGPNVFTQTSTGLSDIFIAKHDSAGNFIWAKRIGDSGDDNGNGISIDTSGNILVVGDFQNTVDFNPNIGVANLTSAGGSDVFILKLDKNGNFIWAKSVGGISYDPGKSICTDVNGNCYTTGSFNDIVDFDPNVGIYNLTANSTSVFVLKLDKNGNFIWAKQFGGGNQSVGFSIALDQNTNVITTGAFNGTGDFDPGVGVSNLTTPGGNYNTFISKLDPSGNFVWAKSFSGLSTNEGFGITTDNTNNIYLTGEFMNTVDFDPNVGNYSLSTGGFYYNSFVTKLNQNGNLVWAKSGGSPSTDLGLAIAVNTYDQVFFTNWQNHLTKLDASGNVIWDVPTGFGNSLVLDGLSSIYLTGKFNGTIDMDPNPGVSNIISVGASDIFIERLGLCQPTGNAITQTACTSYTLNGQTYIASGVYTQTFTNALGCDSIVTLNLTINQATAFTINQSACGGYTLNGQTYNASGTYTQTLVNAMGCDSVITLNLIINQPTANAINQTACTSYTLNGQTYLTSGTFTQTLVNAANCDSIITLNLIINQPSATVLTQSACNSYTLNGQTYNASGTYTQTFVNAANCDSIVTLNLAINTVNVAVTQAGPLLTASGTPATYQWLSCNPYQDIVGETNQTYTATINGEYAVAVTQNGCSDTSACYTVIGIGINNFVGASNIFLYPNPVANILVIENENLFQNASIKILTVTGQTLIERNCNGERKTMLDLSHLISGIYFIEIAEGGYRFVRAVTKD